MNFGSILGISTTLSLSGKAIPRVALHPSTVASVRPLQICALRFYRYFNNVRNQVLEIDTCSGDLLRENTPKGSSSRRVKNRRREDRHTSLRARSPTSAKRRMRPSDRD